MTRIKGFLGLAFGLWLLSGVASGTETCSKTDSRRSGELPSCLALDAVTSNTSSAVIDTFGYRNNGVEIWAATTSVVEVNILCRAYNSSASGATVTAPWKICATQVVNPDNTDRADLYISLPRSYQYQITTTSYVSGTVSVAFERYLW